MKQINIGIARYSIDTIISCWYQTTATIAKQVATVDRSASRKCHTLVPRTWLETVHWSIGPWVGFHPYVGTGVY